MAEVEADAEAEDVLLVVGERAHDEREGQRRKSLLHGRADRVVRVYLTCKYGYMCVHLLYTC